MEKLDNLREIQLLELDILRIMQEVCIENSLTMYLAGGTLLGAVRHGGFIPWDDDIDVSMPRPDYEKFIDIFDKAMKDKNLPYRILRLSNECSYCRLFAKVEDPRTVVKQGASQKFIGQDTGLFVDIFPIDGIPDKTKEYIDELNQIRKICSRISLSFARYDNLSFIEAVKLTMYKIAFSFRNREKLLKSREDKMGKYNFYQTDYIVSTYGLRGVKEILPANLFRETVPIMFEGYEFTAPKGYQTYLEQMYGDYMKLPPEEQRMVPHDFEVYWRDMK